MAGTRPCLLWAPSGYGKSVAAAQFAHAIGGTIWIESAAFGVTQLRLLGSIREALASANGSPKADRAASADTLNDLGLVSEIGELADALDRQVVCVIDDVPEGALGDAVKVATTVARATGPSLRFVLTTRARHPASLPGLSSCFVVGAEQLRLTLSEAEEILGRIHSSDEPVRDARVLWEASGGQAALFAILAQTRAWHSGVTSPRTDTSDAFSVWLGHIVSSEMSQIQRGLLAAMSALGAGTPDDVREVGIPCTAGDIVRISDLLPLVACATRGRFAGNRFVVHDLVVDYVAAVQDSIPELTLDPTHRLAAARLLSNRGDYARAAMQLSLCDDVDGLMDWLEAHGTDLVGQGEHEALRRVLLRIPVPRLVGRPRLLLHSSAVALRDRDYEDAIARANAAMTLAENLGDSRTRADALASLIILHCELGHFETASELARTLVADPTGESSGQGVVRSLVAFGMVAIGRLDFDEARSALQTALGIRQSGRQSEISESRIRHLLGSLPALESGDFATSSRLCAVHVDSADMMSSDRLRLRGNLAVFLVELGRLDRAITILTETVRACEAEDFPMLLGAYLPSLGAARFGIDADASALSMMRQGIALQIECGDEPSAQVDRVYLAVALRAAGRVDESLCEAERAYEHLSVNDIFESHRLAAVEVAASLLALGDPRAASGWMGIADIAPDARNRHRALRASMVLAEISRREGDLEGAVEHLRMHSAHILTGSSNWQIAMYCRAFPALLGVFALAIGAEALPIHMLRMVLPEYAERSLLEAREFMPDQEWRDLGNRLLGEVEFQRFIDRDGVPLCHVHMFGGLEVTVGGKTVRERDWRKRKARLLFAMLVSRRGHDVPRDLVIEYLWPEMDDERARNNLYVAWSTMKSVLMAGLEKGGPCPYVESAGGVCRASKEFVRSDVNDFEEALAKSRECEASGDARGALTAYERIAELYRGDLLPGDVYDDWFANLREHYRVEFIDAMLRVTKLLLDAGDPGNALVFTRRAIQADPRREDLYQHALRCQIAAGQRSSAIDTYFQCRERLAEELGLDPSAETRALYDQILAMEDRPKPTPLDPDLGDGRGPV